MLLPGSPARILSAPGKNVRIELLDGVHPAIATMAPFDADLDGRLDVVAAGDGKPSSLQIFRNLAGLINTARSSLEELLLDYEDYLRHRHLPQWEPASPEAQAVRATARLALRARGTQKDPPDPPNPADPIPQCPQCGKPMSLRTTRTGKHSGRQFWGCTGYPECRGTAEV